MKINRAELIRCLEVVGNALGDHVASLERQCVHIHNNTVFANNGAIASQSILPVVVDFDCAIHGKQFLEFLKSVKGDEIDIKLNDKKELVVKAGKVSAKFVTAPLAANSCIVPTGTGFANVKELIDALIECSAVSATEKTNPVLCGVRISAKDGDGVTKPIVPGYVIATDRARIAKADTDAGITVTVPAKFISVLKKYKDGIKEIVLDEIWGLVIKTDRDMFCTSLLSGDYPNLIQYLPNDEAEKLTLGFDKEIVEVLKRHAAIVQELDVSKRDTTITIKDGIATIATINASVGTLEETVMVNSDKSCVIPFIIDPAIFVDIIDENTEWTFYTETKLLLLKNGNIKYYIQSKKG